MWEPSELLHEGAEATVTAGKWMGKSAVLKMRRPRGYRHPDLDRRLTRSRLSVESESWVDCSSLDSPLLHYTTVILRNLGF